MQRREALLCMTSAMIAACSPRVIRAYRIDRPGPAGFNHRPTRVLVRPIDFSSLSLNGRSEAQFLEGRTAEQQASWAADKVAFESELFRGLRHLPTLSLYREKLRGVTFIERSTELPAADAVAVSYHVGALIEHWMDGTALVEGARGTSEGVAIHAPVAGFWDWNAAAVGSKIRNAGFAFGAEFSRYLADSRV